MNLKKLPMSAQFKIRPIERQDYSSWRLLWDGSNAFYGRSGPTALPEQITSATWERFLNPVNHPFIFFHRIQAISAVYQSGRLSAQFWLLSLGNVEENLVDAVQTKISSTRDRCVAIRIESLFHHARKGLQKRCLDMPVLPALKKRFGLSQSGPQALKGAASFGIFLPNLKSVC